MKLKGVQTLIEAFRRYDAADLLIAGDGVYGDELREQATGSSTCASSAACIPTRCAAVRGATAVLVPSLVYETFGFITLEALAQRTPVIATELGAVGELARESGGGLTYRGEEELVAAMERLRTEPGLREQLGERGYARSSSAGRRSRTSRRTWTPSTTPAKRGPWRRCLPDNASEPSGGPWDEDSASTPCGSQGSGSASAATSSTCSRTGTRCSRQTTKSSSTSGAIRHAPLGPLDAFEVRQLPSRLDGVFWEHFVLARHWRETDVLFCPSYTVPLYYRGRSSSRRTASTRCSPDSSLVVPPHLPAAEPPQRAAGRCRDRPFANRATARREALRGQVQEDRHRRRGRRRRFGPVDDQEILRRDAAALLR